MPSRRTPSSIARKATDIRLILGKFKTCSHFGKKLYVMQIIARRTLRDFWKKHPQAERPLTAWYFAVSKADWSRPDDVKKQFGSTVDFVADNRIIFDIAGNKYRVIVHAAYPFKRILIKFVGIHREYDIIDPETV